MIEPPVHRVRVRVCAIRCDWSSEFGRIALPGKTRKTEDSDGAAQVLKDHARGTVWKVGLHGQECVCKCMALESHWMRLRSWARLSPAWKYWESARWLRTEGFVVAEPLAIVQGRARAEGQEASGKLVECLVLQYMPGQTVLAHCAAHDFLCSQEHQIAREIGLLAARLSGLGRFNRDAKLSNLIVTSVHKTGVHLGMIDCADLRRCPVHDLGSIARMLAAGYIEALGCCVPPRRSLCMRAVQTATQTTSKEAKAAHKELWRAVAAIVGAHGNPMPKDNPL